jgi:hypothetical protein
VSGYPREELKEDLGLPLLRATLVAYRYDAAPFSVAWRFDYSIEGPDARFNPGFASLSRREFDLFVNNVAAAVERMKVLGVQRFSGSYKKSYGKNVEVIVDGGRVWLQLSAASNTYQFVEVLTYVQASQLLAALDDVPSRAARLVQTHQGLV